MIIMQDNSVVKFRIPSFQSGINQSVVDSLVKPYEAIAAKNAEVSGGSLKTFLTPSLKTAGTNIGTIIPFYLDTPQLLAFRDTGVFKLNESNNTWTSTRATIGLRPDCISYMRNGTKVMIMTVDDSNPLYYDGTTYFGLKNRRKVTSEAGVVTWVDGNGAVKTTEAAVTTYAPNFKYIDLHYDRLWGAVKNEDRVWFSTASRDGFDIEDFTFPVEESEANQHGGFIDFPTFDGSKVIGLKVAFNDLLIFKNKSVFKIFGSSPANYQKVQLFNANGAIADKSIVSGANTVFFLNKDGIYRYDGTNVSPISFKIQKEIESLNINYLSDSVGYFYKDKYYLAVPYGSSTVNNMLIEFNTITNSFMIYKDVLINSITEYKDELLISNNTGTYKLFATTGTAKDLYWESPMMDFSTKNAKKISDYVYFSGTGTGSVKFTLTNDKLVSKTQTVTLSGSPQVYRKKLKNKGRMFKLTIENVSGSVFEIKGIELSLELEVD